MLSRWRSKADSSGPFCKVCEPLALDKPTDELIRSRDARGIVGSYVKGWRDGGRATHIEDITRQAELGCATCTLLRQIMLMVWSQRPPPPEESELVEEERLLIRRVLQPHIDPDAASINEDVEVEEVPHLGHVVLKISRVSRKKGVWQPILNLMSWWNEEIVTLLSIPGKSRKPCRLDLELTSCKGHSIPSKP